MDKKRAKNVNHGVANRIGRVEEARGDGSRHYMHQRSHNHSRYVYWWAFLVDYDKDNDDDDNDDDDDDDVKGKRWREEDK